MHGCETLFTCTCIFNNYSPSLFLSLSSSQLEGDPPVSSTFWSCDPSVGVTIQMGTEGAAADKPLTIIDLFHRTVTENGDCIALAYKRAGQWKEINYSQYYELSITIAKAFIKV